MTPTFNPLDCEKEPIHLPAAIQSCGALFVFDQQWNLRNYSENAQSLLRSDTLSEGLPIHEVLESGNALEVKAFFEEPSATGSFQIKDRGNVFQAVLHRNSQQFQIIELEPAREASWNDLATVLPQMRKHTQAIQASNSIDELCRVTVDAVQELTQFDRVMIYCFDEQQNGKVIAERLNLQAGAFDEPFLGLHFPAYCMPSQAHRLYLQKRVQFIREVSAKQSRLFGVQPEELDLTSTSLRAFSPSCLHFHKLLGVQSSLTVSLVENDQLWGVISCHHATTNPVSVEVRHALEVLAEVFAVRLEVIQIRNHQHHLLRSQRWTTEVVNDFQQAVSDRESLSKPEDFFRWLISQSPRLSGLVDGDGFAIVRGSQCWKEGTVPTEAEIASLAEWITSTSENVVVTDELSQQYRPAEKWMETASGIIAVCFDRNRQGWLIWFRREQIQTVTWGGNPDKPLIYDEEGNLSAFHPRASFEAWKVNNRGRSQKWEAWQAESAQQFGVGVGNLFQKFTLTEHEQNVGLERERQLLRDILQVHDSQRKLAACRLHDTLIQNIFGVHLLLQSQSLQDGGPVPIPAKVFRQLVGLLRRAIAEGRRLLSELHPMVLEEEGLVEAIKHLIAEQLEPVGIKVVFSFPSDWPPLSIPMNNLLYHLVQEPVANVIQHSRAKSMSIRLGSDQDEISVAVEDDGVGFDLAQIPASSFGLRGIRERTRLFGGIIEIQTELGKGTRIKIRLPARQATTTLERSPYHDDDLAHNSDDSDSNIPMG